MKKRILAIVFGSLIMCTVVCSCTKQEETKDNSYVFENTNQSTISEVEKETDTSKKTDNNIQIKLELSYDYSEDLAWIIFKKNMENQRSYGCIDKSGNLLFYIDKDVLGEDVDWANVTSFSNGYAYIRTSESLYVLDKSGKIVSTYDYGGRKNRDKAVSYADGYVWFQECVADFNEAYYKYILYDYEGKEITDFVYEGTEPVEDIYYFGEKVWGYRQNDTVYYYFTDGNKWIKSYISRSFKQFYFYDDKAFVDVRYDEDSDIGYLVFVDTKGEGVYKQLPDYVNYSDIKCFVLSEGYCILHHFSEPEYLISYNIDSGEFVKMDNEYVEKMGYIPENSEAMMFENGKIKLNLTGSDEEWYVGLFDTSWNIIGEPLKCSRAYFGDGKLILDEDIYDENLNLLFSIGDYGYKYVSSYHDGVAHATLESMHNYNVEAYGYDDDWFYIGSDGNRLFNSINIESAIKIQL